VIAYSDATLITAIAALFFLAMALLAAGRAMFSKGPPLARRFRVGVFLERDHERMDEDDPAS
jgi:hypothetical protein